jgi:hypothetical protein
MNPSSRHSGALDRPNAASFQDPFATARESSNRLPSILVADSGARDAFRARRQRTTRGRKGRSNRLRTALRRRGRSVWRLAAVRNERSIFRTSFASWGAESLPGRGARVDLQKQSRPALADRFLAHVHRRRAARAPSTQIDQRLEFARGVGRSGRDRPDRRRGRTPLERPGSPRLHSFPSPCRRRAQAPESAHVSTGRGVGGELGRSVVSGGLDET